MRQPPTGAPAARSLELRDEFRDAAGVVPCDAPFNRGITQRCDIGGPF